MLVTVENATVKDARSDHGQIPIDDGTGEAELEDDINDVGEHFTSMFGTDIVGEILLHVTGVVDYEPCNYGHWCVYLLSYVYMCPELGCHTCVCL